MSSRNDNVNLSGKNAVITGGSRGIGRAIALRFGEAGCNVMINYVTNEEAASEVLESLRYFNVEGISFKGDVSNPEIAEEMIDKAVEKFESIDILINNAGIWERGFIGEVDYNHWRRIIRTNLDSAFNCCNFAVPYMKRQRSGKIINISSRSARKGEEGSSAYVASKSGLIGFTRSIAMEVGKYNINVNCIAPAWVESDMTKDYLHKENREKEILKTIPLGRIAEPEDVADVALFLASDLSNYLTGETIFLSGGAI